MTATGYVCRFCRQPSDADAAACPMCGAPFDVRALISRSGWEQVPPIKDMARLQFGRSRLQIEGTVAPIADFSLAEGDSIYFSHHTLLWADAATRLDNSGLGGGWKRVMAGLPLIMMEAWGPGRVALSENHAGEVIALPLQADQRIMCREHRFLAASSNLSYTWENAGVWFVTGRGDDRETHYPLGRFEDAFTAERGPGLLLLHAPGDSFIRDLAPNETILVQPSALLYRDWTVQSHLHLEYPRSDGMISGWRSYDLRTVWLRLVGPGRVAVQSIFSRPESSNVITSSSYATSARW